MEIIKVRLLLDKPQRFKYSDGTFVEYVIFENPFEMGAYNAYLLFGGIGNKERSSHVNIYFPRHSTLSHEYSVNSKVFKLRLVGS